jgi:ferredoxin
MKAPIVELSECIVCGVCVETCPQVFRLNDAGYIEVIELAIYPKREVTKKAAGSFKTGRLKKKLKRFYCRMTLRKGYHKLAISRLEKPSIRFLPFYAVWMNY